MNFEQKLIELKTKMFDLISNKEITYLKDLDTRITINKNGKFCYHKCLEIDSNIIWKFTQKLEENKVYTLIPFISVNNNPDEPYIILSKQILITKKSNSFLISSYISNKISDTMKLYNILNFNGCCIIFKYKEVKVHFEEHNKFI